MDDSLHRDHTSTEPPVTALIMEKLAPGMNFIDVGGNICYYSLLASKIVGNSGMVISFEPDERARAYLLKNKDLNSAGNLQVRSEAVTSYTGNGKLFMDNAGYIGSSILPVKDREFSTVKTITLDDMLTSDSPLPKLMLSSHT
ncbi:MAG TPA: FkbM family methyltransferase [Thermoplasmataceae archaeon]|nr:FkbM family methyltransferase [Thermoplasmatales archaeon AK]HLH85602.1 FkbM family methyltransferase [Thermoplasmataceae archaeon]